MLEDTNNSFRAQSVKELIDSLITFIFERDQKFINLCYKHNISQQEIADTLGITRQALSQRFPKKNTSPEKAGI